MLTAQKTRVRYSPELKIQYASQRLAYNQASNTPSVRLLCEHARHEGRVKEMGMVTKLHKLLSQSDTNQPTNSRIRTGTLRYKEQHAHRSEDQGHELSLKIGYASQQRVQPGRRIHPGSQRTESSISSPSGKSPERWSGHVATQRPGLFRG